LNLMIVWNHAQKLFSTVPAWTAIGDDAVGWEIPQPNSVPKNRSGDYRDSPHVDGKLI